MHERPRLVILVNGNAASAAADRAHGLFTGPRVAGIARIVMYRDRGKAAATVAFFRRLIRTRPRCVYVMDMALSGVLAGVAYRLLRPGTCLIIDTGDAIGALARKGGDRGRLGVLATDALERLGQWAADRLVVRGSRHPDILRRAAAKAVVVRDGVWSDAYAAVPPVRVPVTFSDDRPLVVGVVGSLHWNAALQWCYGVELLEALARLDGLPVRGTIVGDGSGLEPLRERAASLRLQDRITFVDRVPPEQLPAVLGTIDVALSTQTDDDVGRVRTTGKLPLYLAAGRYVLASRVGEATRLLPDDMLVEYDGAFDPHYPARLAERLLTLIRQPARLTAAHDGPSRAAPLDYSVLSRKTDDVLAPYLPDTPGPKPVIYLALGVHRRGGMERAAYEVINRLRPHRPVVVVARESDCPGVPHDQVWTPRRPAVLEVTWYKWRARRVARHYEGCLTTGIGASGGPVDVVVAQYCQEAYRQRVGAIRANGPVQAWWHRRTMARFCADERAVYRSPRLQRVIAVSRGVGRELVDFYGVDPAIIRYIPNGVDRAVFRPATPDEKRSLRTESGLPNDVLLLCFVGGDWRRKGLRPAIESLARVADTHLVIAGAGDRVAFEAYARAVGVASRVHFVGKRPNPEAYMRASDAYVFPSAYEAFSLSCIEAAACGLPMVVTRINGTEELVQEGVNGFFVEQSADSIGKAVARLRNDTALRNALSAAATAGTEPYAWDRIADAHAAAYAELD